MTFTAKRKQHMYVVYLVTNFIVFMVLNFVFKILNKRVSHLVSKCMLFSN